MVADLLLLLGEVRAADVADGALLAEAGEDVEHLGRDRLGGIWSERGERIG